MGSSLPNFFLIGAAKSGTTSLAEHLRQHPEAFLPSTKEPNFYALGGRKLPLPGAGDDRHRFLQLYLHTVTERAKYESLYPDDHGANAIGDASVRYLYFPEAAPAIRAEYPDARFVVVLRDPVTRAFSHHSMMVQFQLEPLDFEAALEAEDERIAAGWGWDWHYTALGRYTDQLARWFEHYDRDRFLVIFYPEFLADPQREYAKICRHLGIDDGFVPDRSKRGKPAYRPKNLTLDRFVHHHNKWRTAMRRSLPKSVSGKILETLREWNSATIHPMKDATREALRASFAPELERLSELLGTDAKQRILQS